MTLRTLTLATLGLLAMFIGCGHGASVEESQVDAAVAPQSAVATPPAVTPFAKTADGAFVTFHPGAMTTTIDGHGASIASPSANGWKVGLHLTRVGRISAMNELAGTNAELRDARVEIARGAGATEWFARDARGIEQGFDLAAKPAGSGALEIDVAVEGLTPVMAPGGRVVELRGKNGGAVLQYGNLAVKDADGREVTARLAVKGGGIAIEVEDGGAKWPLVVDPLVWTQEAEFLATDGAANDRFGTVAVSGTTAIVGANAKTVGSNADQGAAYVFVQSGSTWTQQAKLVASDGATNDGFGFSVAVSGATAIVGATGKNGQGAAYVFVQSGSAWTQQAKLVASDGAAHDSFGQSVAISGTTVIVGAPYKTVGSNADQGAAYVFAQSGSTWTQQAKFVASDGSAGDYFGYSVAISNTTATALVGAPWKTVGSNTSQGEAYVFFQSGGTWTQLQTLFASAGTASDHFGNSVAVSGATAIVGAPNRTVGSNAYQGAAYVFVPLTPQLGSIWVLQGILVASDGAAGDTFGYGVAVSGTTASVGAPDKTVGSNVNQGEAYVFVRSGSTWTQQPNLVASDGAAPDSFGFSVAVSGTTAIVGAYFKKIASNYDQGAAYVFVPIHTNGDRCTSGTDCLSGFCVEGVCCDSACGSCRSCLASRKSAGTDGNCDVVKTGGSDPACTGTACIASGVGPNTCNGAGTCGFPAPVTSCSPYGCNTAASACNTSCTSDSDCDSTTAFCTASVCTPKQAQATACTADDQCTTGHCADGFCCNTACTTKCLACAAALTAGTDGICSNTTNGTDPHGNCPGASCSGSTLTNQVCDGTGACRANTTDCRSAKCTSNGTSGTCANTCTTDGDCGSSGYCNSGTCAPKSDRGGACTANNQCTSNFCVDGVCCDQACTGQCQACAEPGSSGTCIAVKGKPRGTRTDCTGDGTECGGQCDGTNISSCAYSTDVCGSSAGYRCNAGQCAAAANSTCADASTQRAADGTLTHCAPFACNEALGQCFSACSSDADCVAGNECDSTRACVTSGGTNTSSSGGCAYEGTGGEGAFAIGGLAVAAAVVGIRRRRSKRGRTPSAPLSS